jgi:hypothetical protein
MLHSISVPLEQPLRVRHKILDNLLGIVEPAVALLKRLGMVPVEDGHKRGDASSEEGVDLAPGEEISSR